MGRFHEEDEEGKEKILQKKAITFLSQAIAANEEGRSVQIENINNELLSYVLKKVCQ